MRKHRHPATDRNGKAAAPRPPDSLDESIEQPNSPETEGFPQFLRQLRELAEYASYYIAAQADGVKIELRNALINMTLAALALLVVAGLSLGGMIWFALNGAAEGLGLLCGNRPWAGNLLTGSLVAVALGGGIFGILNRIKKRSLAETVAKYENRQSRQQTRNGHNVAERAAADPANDK